MNNKGYISSMVLVVILFFVFLVLMITYSSISNTNKESVDSSFLNDEVVSSSNAKERLFSALSENISLVGNVNYEDLEQKYEVITNSENFEEQNLYFNSYQDVKFSINNKTPIDIRMVVSPIDTDESYSYSARLTKDGVDLLNGEALNLSQDDEFNVDSDFIYNESTGEFNYGDFNLVFDELNNCTVSVYVNYQKLIEREVEVKNNLFNRNIVINNEGLNLR